MDDQLQLEPTELDVRAVRRPIQHWLRLLAALAVIAVLAGAGAWRLSGGTWKVVRTPSMGQAAPVGTLLWVHKTDYPNIHVGDVISFHPPTAPRIIYSHRVIARNADGTLSTRGDLNATADPWRLAPNDVIGRVSARWWVAGWVVRALPILLLGGGLLWGLTRWFCRPAWRWPARLTGSGVIVSIAIWALRPLVRGELVDFTKTGSGARAQIVNTGILPIRVSGAGGHADAVSGQLATVLVTATDRDGRYSVHMGPLVPWPWLVIGALVVITPALYGLLFGLHRVVSPQRSRSPEDAETDLRELLHHP